MPPPLVNPESAGKISFRIPESVSVEVAPAVKPPAKPACGLMNTSLPLMNVLPVAAEGVTTGALGAVVSTLTVVEIPTVFPTWSVPVRV